MELVKQGWLVRGNIVFANEADADEFEQTLLERPAAGRRQPRDLQLLKRQARAQPRDRGLSFARTGARVSYATSISIADARAMLAATAQTLADYFGH